MPAVESDRVFEDIDAGQQCTEIESLCMQCHEQGTTRLLLTRIPHFKEIILMAFECPHCGYRNNEIQSANSIAEKGVLYSCRVTQSQDLNRQVVKSEYGSLRIPDIDFEIPSGTQRGLLNTIEGFIMKAIEDLQQDQPYRKEQDEALYQQIEAVLISLRDLITLKKQFTVILEDHSGNSYIENPYTPRADPHLFVQHYLRTPEQNKVVGIFPQEDEEQEGEANEADKVQKDEVFSFPANCSACTGRCDTKMKMVDIPYFKEVVIMSTVCDHCGYKNNEVKVGGAIASKGRRYILKVTEPEDMTRDLLKSESCGVRIPEIDLELDKGTLGGRFTTLEGLLENIFEELDGRLTFYKGDSAGDEKRLRLQEFLGKLRKLITLEVKPFTFILDDPLGNSYLQNFYAPDPDPNMIVEEYERSWEENEFLGLNDIKTENYQGEQQEEE